MKKDTTSGGAEGENRALFLVGVGSKVRLAQVIGSWTVGSKLTAMFFGNRPFFYQDSCGTGLKRHFVLSWIESGN
jgi:hypothetical protein